MKLEKLSKNNFQENLDLIAFLRKYYEGKENQNGSLNTSLNTSLNFKKKGDTSYEQPKLPKYKTQVKELEAKIQEYEQKLLCLRNIMLDNSIQDKLTEISLVLNIQMVSPINDNKMPKLFMTNSGRKKQIQEEELQNNRIWDQVYETPSQQKMVAEINSERQEEEEEEEMLLLLTNQKGNEQNSKNSFKTMNSQAFYQLSKSKTPAFDDLDNFTFQKQESQVESSSQKKLLNLQKESLQRSQTSQQSCNLQNDPINSPHFDAASMISFNQIGSTHFHNQQEQFENGLFSNKCSVTRDSMANIGYQEQEPQIAKELNQKQPLQQPQQMMHYDSPIQNDSIPLNSYQGHSPVQPISYQSQQQSALQGHEMVKSNSIFTLNNSVLNASFSKSKQQHQTSSKTHFSRSPISQSKMVFSADRQMLPSQFNNRNNNNMKMIEE